MDDLLHVFFRGLFGKKRDVMSLTRIHEQRNTFNPDFFFFLLLKGGEVILQYGTVMSMVG